MKIKKILPWCRFNKSPLIELSEEQRQLLICNRPPTSLDEVKAPWWYDACNKVMYRGTHEGYVKD